MEKGGGWKTSRMTPLPKRAFGPPSYGTFSTPLGCQCSVFPAQKSTTEQTRSSFGRGPEVFGRARSLVRFPPPIRFAPPHSTAQQNILSPSLDPCQVNFSHRHFSKRFSPPKISTTKCVFFQREDLQEWPRYVFAGNCRFSQIGVCPLRFVPLSATKSFVLPVKSLCDSALKLLRPTKY